MVRFEGRPADTEHALAFSAVAEMSLLLASGSCLHDPPLASHRFPLAADGQGILAAQLGAADLDG